MVSPPRRPIAIATRRLVVLFAVWAALVTAWSYAALELLPLPPRSPWAAGLAEKAPPLARWDAGWYRTIVEQGYGPPPPPAVFSEHAFFPLYPAVVALVSRAAGVDPFPAAVVVSIAALVSAAFLFAAEGLRRTTAVATRNAALFLLLFPTAFFFVAAYSESLFLLLCLAAFRQAGRRATVTAALAGFLAGLTRPSALALAAPLALAWWASDRAGAPTGTRSTRRADLVKALVVGAAPAVAAIGWILALGIARGEPGLFFRVERVWQRGPGLVGLQPQPAAAGASPSLALDAASLVLFALIALHQARRRRWSDASWTAGAILLPLSTGTLMSLSRYLVVVYPAFFALAEIFDRRLRLVWWLASGALLAAAVAAFVHWRWVA